MNSAEEIAHAFVDHYARKFAEHGATPEGVDWGPNPADHILRLERMLAVLERGVHTNGMIPSLLDVGCGYGSLLDLIQVRGFSLEYSGIDICSSLIDAAKSRNSSVEWIVGDVLAMDGARRFDYVVCNGILTLKLEASIRDMDLYLRTLVTRMFDLCRFGIAFNVMTTHVNFMAPDLYYRNPIEL